MIRNLPVTLAWRSHNEYVEGPEESVWKVEIFIVYPPTDLLHPSNEITQQNPASFIGCILFFGIACL